MQLKVELFWASAAYNETLKDLVYCYLIVLYTLQVHQAIYLRLQGVSDGDNYAALELWNSTGLRSGSLHIKVFLEMRVICFIIGQVLVG
jgi:hypothetical protein